MLVIFQNGVDLYSIFILIFVVASCLCAPIARTLQERRLRRQNPQMQQARGNQQASLTGVILPNSPNGRSNATHEKNLQVWEEILLTSKDHAQKLEAISRLGKLGTKDTLDLLSEYAEVDRDPEILAAIENALEQLEQKQIERRIRGEIEENPES